MSDFSNPLGTESGSIEAAATAFAGLLDPREDQAQPEDTAAEAEASEADADDGPAIDDEGEQPEASDDETAESEDTDEPEQTRKFTVKIDGKTVEVDETELVQGYQRQADYTRKTQELAAQRQAAQAEAQAIAAERQKYAAGLEQLNAYLQSTAPTPPDASLIDADPVEYMRQRDAYERHVMHSQAVAAEQARIKEQVRADMAKSHQAAVAQERARLLEAIPDWKDEAKAKKEVSAVREFLESHGITRQEIENLTDSRSVVIARKAMLYDQLMSKGQKVQQAKVSEAPKVQKPGTGKSVKTQGQQRYEAKVQQLRKSGRVEDAAAIFRDMF